MAEQYEECRESLDKLVTWYNERKADRNEATTRLHLIDTLFLECLGWSKDDVKAEESQDGEYTDYTFFASRRMLIVEAKREGDYFELPVGTKGLVRSIAGLCRDYANVKQALEQVAEYCQKRGVQFAAVCNGHQIIVFIAVRNDGIAPLDGKALVFASLETMRDNFVEFWDALSKAGVQEKKLVSKLIGDRVTRIPPKLSASIMDYPGIKGRNVFQTDLQILSELIMEDITTSPALEEKFLRECYCKSGALSQHSLLAKQILEARYEAWAGENATGPILVPATTKDGITTELLAESITRRPILLIGDIGVGKTTFIRNLITVEAAKLLENGIVLHIDLGSKGSLRKDLRELILDEIYRQLNENYNIDIYERNFVRGIYNIQLQFFKRGIYGDLEKVDRAEYTKKEIAFLEKKLEKRDEHTRYAVQHIDSGRQQQFVLFLDNADQRTEDVQEQAFLIAQEIAQGWPTIVFVSLRPETFHRSIRSGSLSGYHPKAFSISPPRIEAVLEKRLEFALSLASGEIPIQSLGARTGVKLHTMGKIMRVFLESIRRSDELVRFIDNIAGGNVRIALDLVRQFFGSGHVDTEKIVRTYDESGSYYIPLHEFLRAVIYGDAVHYQSDQSYLANIFDISVLDPKEHFLVPLLIGFLRDEGLKSGRKGFVDASRVYENLGGLGFTTEQIDAVVTRSCKKKLIETGARKVSEVGEPMIGLMRATSIGIYHITYLCRNFSYVDAVIVDTPILDDDTRDKIHDVHTIRERLDRAEVFREYLNKQWKVVQRFAYEFDWKSVSADLGAEIESIRKQI
ncbi:MAG: hypothetical protein WAK60_07170 [Sedimentisphaerales bacterium]